MLQFELKCEARIALGSDLQREKKVATFLSAFQAAVPPVVKSAWTNLGILKAGRLRARGVKAEEHTRAAASTHTGSFFFFADAVSLLH